MTTTLGTSPAMWSDDFNVLAAQGAAIGGAVRRVVFIWAEGDGNTLHIKQLCTTVQQVEDMSVASLAAALPSIAELASQHATFFLVGPSTEAGWMGRLGGYRCLLQKV